MGYIGRPASTGTSTTPTRDTFTGDGTVNFTLSRSVKDNNGNFLEVFVSNVQQEPGVTYSVSGTTLTFTTAPDTDEPIYVIFRDYDTFDVGVVPDSSITAAKLDSDAVETAKIKDLNVTTAKIKDGDVTAAKFAPGSTVAFPINAANIATNAVETAKILNDAVTSDKIAPLLNLQEKILINGSAFSSTTSINLLENSVIYSTAAADTNFTINFKGDGSTTLNSVMSTGNVISAAVLVTNTGTPYYINAYQVDGTASGVTTEVQGGSALTEGNADSIDVYNFSIIKTGDAAYTVLITQTQFA